jgi:transposase
MKGFRLHPLLLSRTSPDASWAHWRRQWFDLAKSPPAPTATEALKRIAELYEIEDEIRGNSANERRAVRQQKTKPLAEALRAWLEKTLAQVAGGSSIALAIRYALNRWDGLVRFLDDGCIEIDSNTVERAMRPIATERSLCPPSSSLWKHWNLIFEIDATRATFSPERGGDPFVIEITGTDLVWSARDDLFSGEHAGFDQTTNFVISDAELDGGLCHRQPFAGFLSRPVGVNAVHPTH